MKGLFWMVCGRQVQREDGTDGGSEYTVDDSATHQSKDRW